MSRSIAAAALACGLALSASAASAGILVPVPAFPGATATYATGINNSNVIAGSYIDANAVSHGFYGTADGNYTSFDFPGGNTFADSINDAGDITGFAEVPNDDCPVLGCEYILKADRTEVAITKGGNPLDGQAEQIVKGKFTGDYFFTDDQGVTHENGFLGSHAHWKSDISLPFENVGHVRGRGLNKKGELVGYYSDTGNGTIPAFLIKDGQTSSIAFDDPDTFETLFEGVNGTGKIVGGWTNDDGSEGQAFIYESSDDTFRVIDVPGETVPLARQVNDSGIITITGATSSYLYCTHKKLCPITAGAIEIKEKIVAAKHPGAKQWVLCRNGCEKDSANVRPASAAQIREAIARDPSLLKELRDRR